MIATLAPAACATPFQMMSCTPSTHLQSGLAHSVFRNEKMSVAHASNIPISFWVCRTISSVQRFVWYLCYPWKKMERELLHSHEPPSMST